MQQENMRPQRNIGINDKLPDEKYQKNKIDVKQTDKKTRSVKLTRKNNRR